MTIKQNNENVRIIQKNNFSFNGLVSVSSMDSTGNYYFYYYHILINKLET